MGNLQSQECESNKIHDRKDLTVEMMQDWCNNSSDVFYNNTMQSKSLDMKIEITADNMEKRRLVPKTKRGKRFLDQNHGNEFLPD